MNGNSLLQNDSITNLIKSEIKRQYKSLRQFSEQSGIPYAAFWSSRSVNYIFVVQT